MIKGFVDEQDSRTQCNAVVKTQRRKMLQHAQPYK